MNIYKFQKNKSPILISNKQKKIGFKLSEKNIFDINFNNENFQTSFNISKDVPSNISEIDNTNYSTDYPLEIIDLDSISLEYDIYISSLKKQLTEEISKRKNAEIKRNLLKHKLNLLKEEEQTNLKKLNYIKNHFNKIIQQRKKIKSKIPNKTSFNKNLKKTKPKNQKLKTSTSASCMTKASTSGKSLKPSISVSSINNSSFHYSINNKNESNVNTVEANKNYEKQKIKLLLLKKLEEDNKKRENIEYEIKQIEKEENELIQQINNVKFRTVNNTIQ